MRLQTIPNCISACSCSRATCSSSTIIRNCTTAPVSSTGRTPDKRRHLMRLWISVPGDRPLPAYFKQRYGSIEIGNRGGIITEKTRLHAPLD